MDFMIVVHSEWGALGPPVYVACRHATFSDGIVVCLQMYIIY